MNPRVDALLLTVSNLREELAALAFTRRQLVTKIEALTAICEDLGRQVSQRDVELARIRQSWVPRRVMDACLRIDGVNVREVVR